MVLAEGGRKIVCLRLIYIYVDLSHTGAAYHGMADGNTLHLKKNAAECTHLFDNEHVWQKSIYERISQKNSVLLPLGMATITILIILLLIFNICVF